MKFVMHASCNNCMHHKDSSWAKADQRLMRADADVYLWLVLQYIQWDIYAV